MKREYFKGMDALAEKMYNAAKEGKVVTAVLFFNEATELMKELLCKSDVRIGVIEIDRPEYDGYEKEYYVSLSNIDYIELFVEKALNECGEYLNDDTVNTVYFSGDASSKIINSFQGCDAKVEIVDDVKCSDDQPDKCVQQKDTDMPKELVFKVRKEVPEVVLMPFIIDYYIHDDQYLNDLFFW